jgi:hypothetical protein
MYNFTINPDDKFYPDANEWMWNYCIFLGKFTDSDGHNYDLGIHKNSAAIVYSNQAGDYLSGGLDYRRECYKETLRRAKHLNLFK